MTKERDEHRELGTIKYAKSDDERCTTFWIGLDFGGTFQGFGGYSMDERTLKLAFKEICEVFGVKNVKELVGKKAYALRNFSGWNESIIGIESYDTGRRWVAQTFFKREYPKQEFHHPLEDRLDLIDSQIANFQRRIKELTVERKTIASRYKHWE